MKVSEFLERIAYEYEDQWDPEIKVQFISELEMLHPSSNSTSGELVEVWPKENAIYLKIVIKEQHEKAKTLHI